MGARRRAILGYGWALLALCGCSQWVGTPAARPPEQPAPPPTEHVEVVADTPGQRQTPHSPEPDPEAVRLWIEQIQRRDDLATRVGAQPHAPTGLTLGAEQEGVPEADEPVAVPVVPQPDATSASSPADASDKPEPLEPPRLERVTVSAGEAIPAEPPPHSRTPPAVNAPARATNYCPTLDELIDQWLAEPADTSFRWQLDRRLLLVLAGRYEEARRPLELVSDEQQQMAGRLIELLVAVREAQGGNLRAEASRVLAELERLSESLAKLSDLEISALVLARAVYGFGRYEAFDPPQFPAGRETEIVVYCEVRNFLSRQRPDGRWESRFALRTTVFNGAGDVILELSDDPIVDECQTRRHDCFIPRLITLPATLSPGEYVVKTTLVDKIGQKVAERRTTFRVVARS